MTATALQDIDVATPLRKWPRYSEYRKSEIEYHLDIPSHWERRKVAHAFRTLGSGTTPKSDNLDYYGGDIPWVTTSELRESIISETTATITDKAMREHSALKLYPRGTLLFAMYGATIGRLGLLGINATVNQACCAIGNSPFFDIKYAYYWFYSRRDVLVAMSTGGGQPNLSQDDLRHVKLPCPPLDEQRGIATFLDRETARIDELIAKKQRLIELLKEKRQATISHSVTKGLDPNAPMKPSGIDWLGDVPEHWTMKRLKHVADLQTGLTLGKKYAEDIELTLRPYLRVANVQDGFLDLSEITTVQVPPADVPRYELRPGDVLLTEGGDFDKLGRGYVWDGQIDGCLHQNHIFAVRSKPNLLDSHLLAMLLSSSHGRTYFTSTSQQTTNLASTNSTKLKEFPIPLPPKGEQLTLRESVTRSCKILDDASNAVQLAIHRLKEHRSALITAAATGQIDVRQLGKEAM